MYFDRDRACFIRVGGAPGAEIAMAAHGGLVGAVLSLWFSSRRKKKMESAAKENVAKSLGRMLAEHKANRAVNIVDISDAALEPGNWAMRKGTVLRRFQVRGEKKRSMCTFPTAEETDAALDVLSHFLPNLRIEFAKDPKSGKHRKKR